MRIRALRDSPFAVDVLPFRRRPEQWELAVVAKATYAVEPGACRLLSKPIPVFAEERRFDDAASSIYAPRDLVPAKACPEIVVVGAEEGASIRFPGRAPQPLRRPPVWPPPGAGAGAPWHVTDLAASPLGEDFDGSLFQYAPVEQRLEELSFSISLARPIVLDEADSRSPEIKLVFPPIEPAARIETLESTARTVVMTPELLWVDVERGVGTMTWRGTTTTELADGFEVVIGISEGGDVRWPTQQGRTSESSWQDDDDPIELATEVAPTAAAQAAGVASDTQTYTGEHRIPSAHDPAWLAPAGAGRAPDHASSPPPPLAAAAEGQRAAPIVPHPAREMIADPRQVPVDAPSSEPPESSEPAPGAPLALDLFWRDEACAKLVERQAAYRELVASELANDDNADQLLDPWWDDDDEEESEEELELEEIVILVLHDAVPTPLPELERALMRAIDARRRVTAPVGMLAGELRLGFDARAELEVYARAARPLAASDKNLAATLDHVEQLLDTPLADVVDVARGQRARIAKQWRAANRDLPGDFLERSAHEILLQQRSFDKREVLDERHLRALLVEGSAEVPVYLPESACEWLPLFHAFDARVIAELWPRQDEREAHPVSLRAMALARVILQ